MTADFLTALYWSFPYVKLFFFPNIFHFAQIGIVNIHFLWKHLLEINKTLLRLKKIWQIVGVVDKVGLKFYYRCNLLLRFLFYIISVYAAGSGLNQLSCFEIVIAQKDKMASFIEVEFASPYRNFVARNHSRYAIFVVVCSSFLIFSFCNKLPLYCKWCQIIFPFTCYVS